MILYADNARLNLPTVTTIDGNTEYRRNCKFIKGGYYTIDIHCVEVGGRWFRKNSGYVVLDSETGKWVDKKDPNLINGIIGFNKNKQPITGTFSPNIYNNVITVSGSSKVMAINSDILEENGWIEDVAFGIWYNRASLTNTVATRLKTIRNEMNFHDRGYNIEDNAADFERKQKYWKEYNPKLSKECITYSKMLGNITFGAEIEISHGYLPEHLQNRTGVVICRDGSIGGGPELVTIPLNSAKGINTLMQLSQYLRSRGEIDINCSFHLHIGNIPEDKQFLVTMYLLCFKIQDEIFKMFPYYKTDPKGFKKKNYNQKLKRYGIHPLVDTSKEGYESYIDDVYEKIFAMLTEGSDDRIPGYRYNRSKREHPIRQKWNRAGRYYWMNLMNMIFSKRNTVEFRLHTPTVNAEKMITWLFMCNAIIKYASLHQADILKAKDIKLNDIFSYYEYAFPTKSGKFLSNYLKAYYKNYVSLFERDIKNGDFLSEWDIKKDKTFSFQYEGADLLF